jgi:hypothetical protein
MTCYMVRRSQFTKRHETSKLVFSERPVRDTQKLRHVVLYGT